MRALAIALFLCAGLGLLSWVQQQRVEALDTKLTAVEQARDTALDDLGTRTGERDAALAALGTQTAAIEQLRVESAARQAESAPRVAAADARARTAEQRVERLIRSAPSPPDDCAAASAWIDQQLDEQRGPP